MSVGGSREEVVLQANRSTMIIVAFLIIVF